MKRANAAPVPYASPPGFCPVQFSANERVGPDRNGRPKLTRSLTDVGVDSPRRQDWRLPILTSRVRRGDRIRAGRGVAPPFNAEAEAVVKPTVRPAVQATGLTKKFLSRASGSADDLGLEFQERCGGHWGRSPIPSHIKSHRHGRLSPLRKIGDLSRRVGV